MRRPWIFLGLGIVFGFVLSRAGATDPQRIAELFLFRDLHLLWVIVSAVVVGAVGIQLIRRLNIRALGSGAPIDLDAKPWTRGLILGSVLFGIGWGLTGICPGTGTTMIGEGKLFVLYSLAGVLVGTWGYARWLAR
ncbi:MAG: DUF6691 family protein [Halothiobacillaceae bacterium]